MAWDIGSLLTRAFTLMAMVIVFGGIFCLYLTAQSGNQVRRHLLKYIKIGALAGIIASSLYFFIQVGAFNQSGLSGMFDTLMISILAQSGLGYAALFRFIAFFMILSLAIFKNRLSQKKELTFGKVSLFIFTVAMLLIAYSFSLIGHVAELTLVAASAIGLHILAISLWVGSLYPLWYLCKHEEVLRLQKIMQRFGELAIIFVGVLLITGIFIVVQLLESTIELVTTSYGLTLLFKLTGVLALLFLGAMNKLKLVPRLTDEKGVVRLQRSIAMELGLALLVLIITAYLTTLVGLSHSG